MGNTNSDFDHVVSFHGGLIFFKVGDQYKPIPAESINYFFANEKHIYAKMANRKLAAYVLLKTVEKILYPNFLRCHKKYIVDVQKIEAIKLKEGKVVVNGEALPIGMTYRKHFLAQLCLLK